MKSASLAIICSDMTVMKEFLERTSEFFIGSQVISYPNIPFLKINSSPERIEKLKTYLLLISILEDDFINKILFFGKEDFV